MTTMAADAGRRVRAGAGAYRLGREDGRAQRKMGATRQRARAVEEVVPGRAGFLAPGTAWAVPLTPAVKTGVTGLFVDADPSLVAAMEQAPAVPI
jgi:hypothetical protein